MKLKIDILAKDESLQDFVTASFLKEVNNSSNENLSVSTDEETGDDGLNSRDGLMTLFIQVLGGVLTFGQLAELIYKHFISKGVDIKIKSESGEEIEISGNEDLVEMIEFKLKKLQNESTKKKPTDKK